MLMSISSIYYIIYRSINIEKEYNGIVKNIHNTSDINSYDIKSRDSTISLQTDKIVKNRLDKNEIILNFYNSISSKESKVFSQNQEDGVILAILGLKLF